MKKRKEEVSVSPERSIKKKRRKALDRRDVRSFIVRLVGLVLFVILLFYVIWSYVKKTDTDFRESADTANSTKDFLRFLP